MSNAQRLYVGNLPYSATESEVRALFEGFGPVREVKLISRDNKPAGFGFVEMENAQHGQTAISELDRSSFGGRNITVSVARERRGGDRRRH